MQAIFEKAIPRIVHDRHMKVAGRVTARGQHESESRQKRISQLVSEDMMQITDASLGQAIVRSLSEPNKAPYEVCVADMSCTCPDHRFCQHIEAVAQLTPLTHQMRQNAAAVLVRDQHFSLQNADVRLLHCQALVSEQKPFLVAVAEGEDAGCSCHDWLAHRVCCHLLALVQLPGLQDLKLSLPEPDDTSAVIPCDTTYQQQMVQCGIDDAISEHFVALSVANNSASQAVCDKVAADPTLVVYKSKCSTAQRLFSSLPQECRAPHMQKLDEVIESLRQEEGDHQFPLTQQTASKQARRQLSRKPQDRVQKPLYGGRKSVHLARAGIEQQRAAIADPLVPPAPAATAAAVRHSTSASVAVGTEFAGLHHSAAVPPHTAGPAVPAPAEEAGQQPQHVLGAVQELHEFPKVTAPGRPATKVSEGSCCNQKTSRVLSL